MSKLAEGLTLRLARADDHDALEELQRRASLELPEYRDQLIANPDAIYLPEGQIANGQVIVAELDGEMVKASGARVPDKGKLKAIEDAPGTYVKSR